MKKILFLSALDFKEKSIQVIRKTPEAYADRGWEVKYIVARDTSPTGNYFYERIVDVPKVNVSRFNWPMPKLRAKSPRHLSLVLTKISSAIVTSKLAYRAAKEVVNDDYDIVYGYELQGVLAMHLIKPFLRKRTKTVSRFQGTFLNEMLVNKQYSRLAFNLDLIIAIFLKSNLLIMTNDGTQGDLAVKKIKNNKRYDMLFIPNGVDHNPYIESSNNSIKTDINFITVSRLVGWKRVDRSIRTFHAFKKLNSNLDCKLNIVGEGSNRASLEQLVSDLGISDCVNFVGGISHEQVSKLLAENDVFLSMYQSSNVGNPLLESIRANLLIVTLNNGDTGRWIKHKANGLIYDEDSIDYQNIAKDIYHIVSSESLLNSIKINLSDLEQKMLFSWVERFDKEIEQVTDLLTKR